MFVVSSTLKLTDDDLKAGVHVVFLFLDLLEVDFELLLVFTNLCKRLLKVFETALGICECHLVLVEGLSLLFEGVALTLCFRQGSAQSFFFLFKISNDVLVGGDRGLDFL